MRNWLVRRWWVLLLAVGVMLAFPLAVGAITAPEVLQVLEAVIQGVLTAGRDAYCALGVAPLCP